MTTHMHPLGCFGSSLAFAPQSTICGSCSSSVDCQALVEARRPLMMRLLEKFLDATGKPMSLPWMTTAERRDRRKQERAADKAEAEETVFGDAAQVMELKLSLDARAHPTINRFVKLRTNPKVASLETLAATTRPLAAVVNALRDQPRSMRELSAIVAQRCGFSAQNAQREAYSTVSILRACDRVTQRGQLLEIA